MRDHDRTRPGDESVDDDNVVLDAQDDRWEWRRRIRSNPASHRAYRTAVGVLGLVVVVVGLIAVPAPGPGWLIVFVGVSLWASEFEWAQRLLFWGKAQLREWNDWRSAKPWWVTGLVGLSTAAVVGVVLWGYLAWSGSPGWLPDRVEALLDRIPGVSDVGCPPITGRPVAADILGRRRLRPSWTCSSVG